MPSFDRSVPVSNAVGTEGSSVNSYRVSGFGVLERSDTLPYSTTTTSLIVSSDPAHTVSIDKSSCLLNINPSASQADCLRQTAQIRQRKNLVSTSIGTLENWGESTMADASPRTDISTDGDVDEKHQRFGRDQSIGNAASDSSDRSKEPKDQKTLRRLAQNREAARKSRLRKKAYVQQLESSRLKLTQLEQELQRARQQGVFISNSGDQAHSMGGNGAITFDVEYARWLEEQNRQINELRSAVNAHASDTELRIIVDGVMAHYEEIFRLKANAAKNDVFHLLSGMWKTPAERCFLWLGGFRSSELLKKNTFVQ